MPDELNQHEKKIIQDALEQGRVQKIPQGQSGIRLEEFSYKEYYKRQQSIGIRKSSEAKRRKAEENRRKIAKFMEEGMTVNQICNETGLHENTVRRHIRDLRSNE